MLTAGVHTVDIVTALFAAVLFLAAIARRLVIPYPILLVLGGLVLGFIPGLPVLRLEPDLVFLVFLPPILWSAAYFTSLRDFRRNLRPISLLAFGLVLATTAVVAVVARHFIPGMPWAAAVVLGAIISPPDAVAAVAILRRLRIPHRVVVVLEGESLINDATALILYRTAVLAVVTGTFSLGVAVGQFFLAAIGGVAIGLIISWLVLVAARFTDDRLTEIAVTILAPYIAWTAAERLGASAVLACVAGGFLLRRNFSSNVPPATRLQARAVWDLLVFSLNGVIFILIGLQLRWLAQSVPRDELVALAWQGLAISLAVILVRLVWVPLAAVLPRLSPSLRERDPMPPWQAIFVISWTGMRGIVSLAAALALPLVTADGRPLPFREQIILITFAVIFVTLVLQGLTLGPLIRKLNLPDDRTLEREEALARERALKAGLARLDAIAGQPWAAEEHVEGLRRHYAQRTRVVEALREGGVPSTSLAEAAFKRTRYETLTAERESLIALRNEGAISDDVLLELEQELDREAVRLGLAEVRSPTPARR